MVLRAVLGSLCLASAALAQPLEGELVDSAAVEETPTHEPGALETTSLSDDLIGAPGLRPIRGGRIEALVSTGSHSTHRADARVTTRRGAVGLELDGRAVESDGYAPLLRSERNLGTRLEHESGTSHTRVFGRWSHENRGLGNEHEDTDARGMRYGGRWTLSGPSAHVDVQLLGEAQQLQLRDQRELAHIHTSPLSTYGGRGSIKSRRLHALASDHELVFGAGYKLASGEQRDAISPSLDQRNMTTVARKVRGDHRFLDAYIEDTVRFIRTLDITGGLVIEKWSNLGGDSSITYGLENPMEEETPDVSMLLLSPSLGAVHRIDDSVAIRARSQRAMRAPTADELYRPALIGDSRIAGNHQLRPETVWTSEVGAELTRGRVSARASMFHSTIDNAIGSTSNDAPLVDGANQQRANIGTARVTGVDSEASWRPTSALLATVTYTFAASTVSDSALYPQLVGKELALMPRQRASAAVTFDEPRFATVTGAVRYVASSFEDDLNTQRIGGHAVVDAVAARKVTGGLTGVIGINNLFDRRYVADRTGTDAVGAPRTFHVGLRIDSNRF